MCQCYAFTWLQIHPESKLHPWLECKTIMHEMFGKVWPTLGEMIKANPGAVREYFSWNLSLLPSGLQVALFDRMSGTINPGHGPVRHAGDMGATVLGLSALLVAAFGMIAAIRRWGYWWPTWFRPRRGLWLLMFALICASIPVIVAIRPRASFFFPTTFALMAMIGTAIHVLLPERWLASSKLLAIVTVPLLVIFVPSYYLRHPSERPLYTNYMRLAPFNVELSASGDRVVLGDGHGELTSFLRLTKRDKFFGYEILSSWQATEPLDRFLRRERISMFFIQPDMMRNLKSKPEAHQLLEQPETLGWRRLAPTPDSGDTWLLLSTVPQNPAPG